ncbi:hypothetical protein Tco_0593396 [Tanacetum coccineum]
MKDLVENKPRTEEDKEIRMNPRCSTLLQNHLPAKEQDPRSFILPCSIGKLDFNNTLADLGASINVMPLSMFKDEEDDLEENLEDLEESREDKTNAIMRAIQDKLNDDWFNNTSEDEDDLEGILDYLEPRSYDGFIDLDDIAYNKRRCKLFGMTYEEPTPILIKKVKVSRYTVGPGSLYKEVEFEDSLTRFHAVTRFCLGVTTLVTP